MAESEPVRALRAARESDEVDARRDVKSRLRRHLIRKRNERFVDPQIRERQAFVRDRVVMSTSARVVAATEFRPVSAAPA